MEPWVLRPAFGVTYTPSSRDQHSKTITCGIAMEHAVFRMAYGCVRVLIVCVTGIGMSRAVLYPPGKWVIFLGGIVEYGKDRSWAATFGGLALAMSSFVGCMAEREKPIPIHPETIHGPDVGSLIERRVLVPGTLSYIHDIDDTDLLPMYGVGAQGVPTFIGFIPNPDTDYLYLPKVDRRFGISTVGDVRTETRIHEAGREKIPAILSGILLQNESGELFIDDIRVEQYGSVTAERE